MLFTVNESALSWELVLFASVFFLFFIIMGIVIVRKMNKINEEIKAEFSVLKEKINSIEKILKDVG